MIMSDLLCPMCTRPFPPFGVGSGDETIGIDAVRGGDCRVGRSYDCHGPLKSVSMLHVVLMIYGFRVSSALTSGRSSQACPKQALHGMAWR